MPQTLQISLESIDWAASQRRFCLRRGRATNALCESILAQGQISPLVLRGSADVTLELVCGFGRVEAMQTLGVKEATGRLLSAATSDQDCLVVAIHDNAYGRGFNPAEAVQALGKLRDAGCTLERLRTDVAPLLRLPKSDKVIAQYLSITALPTALQEALAVGEIQKEHAFAVQELDECDRTWFCEHVLPQAKLSASELREVCTQIVELKLRDSLELNGVLSAVAWQELARTDMSPRDRGQTLRSRLSERRYPRLTSAKAQFTEAASAIRLPDASSIRHAPNFEDDDVTLQARIANVDGMKALAQELLTACEDGRVRRLFEAASGKIEDEDDLSKTENPKPRTDNGPD